VLAERTTLDNVAIGALARGISFKEACSLAKDAIALFGLGEKLAMPANLLSGGEQQRVTIARCLISPSSVILADEPTGNLDAANTMLVAQSLRAAAAGGKIVVVATHDPDVVAECGTVLDLRISGSQA
jgi:ABC-type lipoprotein export system ATPase subunit